MFAKAILLILIFGLIILAITFSFILRIVFWIRDIIMGKDHSKYKATNSSFGYDFNRGASAQGNTNADAESYSNSSAKQSTSQPKRKKIYDDNEGEYAEFEEIE